MYMQQWLKYVPFVSVVTDVNMSDIEENHEELIEMVPKGPHGENIEETTEKGSESVTSDVKTMYVKSAIKNKLDTPETLQCTCESGVVGVDQKHSCEKDVQLSIKTEDVPKVKRKRGCWDYVKDMDIYKMMT